MLAAAGAESGFFLRAAYDPDTTFGYRQLDPTLLKRREIWQEFAVNLRTDILIVFNYENADLYTTFRGNFPAAHPNFADIETDQPPPRTFKLSVGVSGP